GRAGRASPRTGISIDRTPPAGLLSAHTRGRHTAAREGRMEAGMDWQKEMDELRRREALAEELGGLERVRRQHDGGRYTIRERIAKLVDPGTFHELGDRKSTRLNSSHDQISYAVFCLKKKIENPTVQRPSRRRR